MLTSVPQRYFRPLRDVSAIRKREQESFAQEGDSFPMMMRAGMALWQHIQKRVPELGHLAIVVGGGNNGGDGLIVAYLAAQEGFAVHLYDASSQPRQGDAQRALSLVEDLDGVIWRDTGDLVYETSAVVLDALLGIGFKAPLSPTYEVLIDTMNRLGAAGSQLISVDCPSGLELASGYAELAVQADLVVTFIDDKVGHYLRDGAVCCHEVVTENLQAVDLSEPPQAYFLAPSALDLYPPCPRFENSHKGTYGHVSVIGGDLGFGGAAIMASEAAAKSGAGTVSLYTQASHLSASLVRNPNVMCVTDNNLTMASVLRGESSGVVVGPGLGRSEWSKTVWQQVVAAQLQNLVIDADGLYWLTQLPTQAQRMILTPHPGEAAMLLGCAVKDVLDKLPESALQLAQTYQAVVILKGATSVIANPAGGIVIVGEPRPALAKGGAGDVLSGMVGTCLAYYQDAFEAAVLAAAWHNRAAHKGVQQVGELMLQPYQLLDYLA